MNSVSNPSAVDGKGFDVASKSDTTWRWVCGILVLEARMEFLRLLRTPSFAVPVLAFPIMFYLLFGVLLAAGHPDPADARHVLGSLMVFGVMAPGLFGVGVTLAMDRDKGLLELKRALPMPAGAYLGAKLLTAVVFAGIVAALMMVTAATLGKVQLGPTQWLCLFAVALPGVLPFCALGLMVGTLVRGQGAPAVLNLIYLPMSFLSGLWIPLALLPPAISRIAPLWPSYHLVRITLSVVGVNDPSDTSAASHGLVLLGMTGVFLAFARRRLIRSR